MLKDFWEIESLGIKEDDEKETEQLLTGIHHNGERYEVQLPWKEEHPLLPDNYQICVRRLQALMKRLKSKPEMLAEYDKIIQDQLAEGIIEVVPEKGSEVGRNSLHPT